MDVARAIELVKGISYRPDWTFTATDHTKRFQESIVLRIDYVAPDTDVKWAPDYAHIINTHANFVIPLGFLSDEEFYREVYRAILDVEMHESREFFAVEGQTFRKPVHPHTDEGMLSWAANFNPDFHNTSQTTVRDSIRHDLLFGVK